LTIYFFLSVGTGLLAACERIELADGSQLADLELLTTLIVMNSSDKHRDNLAVADVHHTMGELEEALHEATQCLHWALRHRKKVIKGSQALVPALERVNELLAQIFHERMEPRGRRCNQSLAGAFSASGNQFAIT
jgi:hypothetical protein